MGFFDFLKGGGAHLQDSLGGGGGIGDFFSKLWGTSGGDEGDGTGLKGLFSNPLFLQYLSAAGQDIGGTGPTGAHTNAVTGQNISSQNMLKMFSKMLSGDLSDGGSIVHKDGESTIKLPHVSQEAPPIQNDTGAQVRDFFRDSSGLGQRPSLLENLNPFVSSHQGFKAADLAGLTPEMISQALQFKMNREDMKQKSIMDAFNVMFKGAQLGSEIPLQTAQTAVATAQAKALTPSISVPGLGMLTVDDYNKYLQVTVDKQTSDEKNFAFAKTLEGGSFTGPFNEFINSTTDWKDYNFAGGFRGTGLSYDKWLTRNNESKRMVIGLSGELDKVAAMNKLKGGSGFFTGAWTTPIDKIDSTDSSVMDLTQQYVKRSKASGSPMSYTDAKTKALLDTKLNAVMSEIVSRGGEIDESKLRKEGNTYIFTVHWPSIVDQNGRTVFKGQTGEVKYVYR